jgi:hypothetical protein
VEPQLAIVKFYGIVYPILHLPIFGSIDVFGLCRIFAPIAQVVEQLPFKEWVVGSNPTGRTVNTLPGWVKLFESNWAHKSFFSLFIL